VNAANRRGAEEGARGQPGGQVRPEQARPGGAPRRLGLVAAAWIAVAVVAIALGVRLAPHAPRAPSTASPPSMPPRDAYGVATRLSDAGHHLASLPYYRMAEAGATSEDPALRFEHAGALYLASFEVQPARGRIPATRSSVERVALMREACGRIEGVMRLELAPPGRAQVCRKYGEILQSWGFNWEAFVEFRQAQWSDPAQTAEADHAQAFMTLMQHPDRYSLEAVPIAP
jgi:hypothetical protein